MYKVVWDEMVNAYIVIVLWAPSVYPAVHKGSKKSCQAKQKELNGY